MDKLIDYICDELEDIERKSEKGKLSLSEIQYADTLAHLKKNLLKSEKMKEEEEGEMSYARKRDGMGRYSREGYSNRRMMSYDDGMYSRGDDFRMELDELIKNAPNEHIKRKMQAIISEM